MNEVTHGMHIYQRLLISATLASVAQVVPAEEIKSLEPVEVVGTRIKRTDWETPAPVYVITSEEIRHSGARSVQELLNDLPSVSDGSLFGFDGNTFSPGASAVALRGLGASSTLVLIDGRRMTAAPYADPNTGKSTVYNLSAIPLDMVERVEVQPNGASAIYGSDAVAGVINIVLRKNYAGNVAGVRYSSNEHGQFGNRSVYATTGFGDLSKDGYNGFISVSGQRRDRVLALDTTDVAEDDLRVLLDRGLTTATTSYPPNYFRESTLGNGRFTTFVQRDARCPAAQVLSNGRCSRNPWPMFETMGSQSTDGLVGGANFRVGSDLTLFTQFGFSRMDSRHRESAFSVTESGNIWFARDGSQRSFQFILPVGHPDNPVSVPVAARYNFSDVGPLRYNINSEAGNLLGGLRGFTAGWEWESALSYSRLSRTVVRKGLLHAATLQQAINTLAYRPFGNNSPQTLAAISPDIVEPGKASNLHWDLKGTRELMQLAGGPLVLAAGTELRRERLSITSDQRVFNGEFMGIGSYDANASRNVASLYAELSAPFIKQLETQFAFRYDRYSDYGDSFTPFAGVKWKPLDTLSLRAAYSTGFRAPSLAQSGTSNVQGFNSGLRDPLRCRQTGGTDRDCNFQSSVLIRGTPDLDAETSDSRTFGIIFAPNKAFDMAIDYYRINRFNAITTRAAQTVLTEDSTNPELVIRDPDPATWRPGMPNSGPVLGIIREFGNRGGETTVSGVEADATLRTDLGEWGKLATRFRGNYTIHFKTKATATSTLTEFAGWSNTPRFKGNLSATWTYRDFSLTGRINYVDGWRYGSSNTACFWTYQPYLDRYDCRIPSWTTVDLHMTYRAGKTVDLGFGVRNITDKPAPFDPDYGTSGYNPYFHNGYGRYYSVWASVKF